MYHITFIISTIRILSHDLNHTRGLGSQLENTITLVRQLDTSENLDLIGHDQLKHFAENTTLSAFPSNPRIECRKDSFMPEPSVRVPRDI